MRNRKSVKKIIKKKIELMQNIYANKQYFINFIKEKKNSEVNRKKMSGNDETEKCNVKNKYKKKTHGKVKTEMRVDESPYKRNSSYSNRIFQPQQQIHNSKAETKQQQLQQMIENGRDKKKTQAKLIQDRQCNSVDLIIASFKMSRNRTKLNQSDQIDYGVENEIKNVE